MHVRININLKVDRNALKFAINAKDFGALTCAMDIPVGEILRPKSMDIDEFQATAAGFGWNERSIYGTIWCRSSWYGYRIVQSEKTCKRRVNVSAHWILQTVTATTAFILPVKKL